MRVGLLTQWFDPEPGPAALPGVLARGLVERGHHVQVVTGFPNYPTGRIAPGYQVERRSNEVLDGVRVRRVALYPSHDSSSVRRVANYASFGLSASISGVGALRDLDAVWVNYSPITIAWPMWVSRFAFRTPIVTHVLDLWPDTLLAGGFAREGASQRALQRVLDAWCGAMYRSSSSVAYISPGVGHVLEQRGVPEDKLEYVPMWADEDVFRPEGASLRSEYGVDPNRIVLLYAGALGEAQGLDTLLDACALVTDPRFECIIAGSGVSESSLRARATNLGLTNVRFIGRVPQSRMTDLMATGDVNYVALRPHALSPITMPSKTQAALASGRPILVAARGDVADVAVESEAGIVADPGDPASIAAAITDICALGHEGLRAMGAKGRDYYRRTFSVDHGVTRIESLLERAIVERKRGR
ncbi:glycosyltransferase family 4 protein [Occultella kanbiaonis]|uniref:glycosyltransferase family 4 protein n=1 Tax=Occultella kanbiaonis TaxID=2675754 RepID=UPI0013D50B3A|nr:glycosyltransferase family 4 protein [Occultella kanbiaonis]